MIAALALWPILAAAELVYDHPGEPWAWATALITAGVSVDWIRSRTRPTSKLKGAKT